MQVQMKNTPKVDVIVDLQFGSTGKGLIAGVMAKKFRYDTVMNANMPNAGHTFIDRHKREWIHKVLPNGIVSPNLKRIMLGAGSIFDTKRLEIEIQNSYDILAGCEILIHPNAVVLNEHHKDMEQNTLQSISSTMQGSSTAMTDKIRRQEPYPTAWANGNYQQIEAINKYFTQVDIVICSHDNWNIAIAESEQILLEGAQGFSLGINERFYPFCTSRDCTPARFMADCGVPLTMLRRVVGTARLHPIRVGNTKTGYSGDGYPDQRELTWEELGVKPETTTVTGRVRRVFTFSEYQIRDAIFRCQPDWVFLNFCNYDPNAADIIKSNINALMQMFGKGGNVQFTGWGPTEDDVRMMGNIDPCDWTREEHQAGYVK